MILLTVRELTRQFDSDPVFQNVTFDLRPGERVGLVGPNGTGKTTLLNVLSGRDHADKGEIEQHPSARIDLLEQHTEFPPDLTLLQEAKSGLSHLYELQEQSHQIAEQMAQATDPDEEQRLHRTYDQLQQELQRLDAYNIDHKVDEVLIGLGFTKDVYDRPLCTFSGGQQNRVLLAKLLLRAPEVMLLDEPTNHLDIAATEWLENYLTKTDQAIILVSHDRFFLDKVTTRILEMHSGYVTDYPGNFTAYWNQREERQKVLQRTYEKQQEFIAKTEDFIRKNKYGQKHAQAADREKKLERLERVQQITDIAELPMGFGEPTRTGDLVIEASKVSKGFDEGPLFSELSLRVNRGDRLGIVGANGTGKTTLLRTLLGELEPDEGSVRLGTGVNIGYFDQQLAGVSPDADAIEAVRPPHKPEVTPGQLRGMLARFGIQGDMVFRPLGSMSGGERSKVALTKLASLEANVLVLDEPTNHLDLWAVAALERSLKKFEGTILFVSHDRYFLDRVATSVVVLEENEWTFHEGNYSALLRFQQGIAEEFGDQTETKSPATKASKPEPDNKPKTNPKSKRKFPYRKVSDLEDEIAEKEELLEQLETDLGDPDVHKDPERLRDTTDAYEETQEELAELYEHWEESIELN